MAIFCLKNLESLVSVGERLKKARENQKMEMQDIAVKTRMPVKYIEAIETCRYNQLPEAKAHRLAYVRAYAEALGLNPASFIYQFSQECNLDEYHAPHPLMAIKLWPLGSLTNIFKSTAIACLVVGFLGYLVWQINGILHPPKLIVYSPSEGYVSTNLLTIVQGETEKEVRLQVNGKEIMANEQGKFEAEVDLSNGVNTITISAMKKHGKTTTVTRHVIVKAEPKNTEAPDKLGMNY
ncbi:MAG: helix-turn-helix domain-containing protein [Patescibacteria group bacterium]